MIGRWVYFPRGTVRRFVIEGIEYAHPAKKGTWVKVKEIGTTDGKDVYRYGWGVELGYGLTEVDVADCNLAGKTPHGC
jgi:hypothetical protein